MGLYSKTFLLRKILLKIHDVCDASDRFAVKFSSARTFRDAIWGKTSLLWGNRFHFIFRGEQHRARFVLEGNRGIWSSTVRHVRVHHTEKNPATSSNRNERHYEHDYPLFAEVLINIVTTRVISSCPSIVFTYCHFVTLFFIKNFRNKAQIVSN